MVLSVMMVVVMGVLMVMVMISDDGVREMVREVMGVDVDGDG